MAPESSLQESLPAGAAGAAAAAAMLFAAEKVEEAGVAEAGAGAPMVPT